jgi:hypothetical protein
MEADIVRGFEKLVQDYATVQLLEELRAHANSLERNMTGLS